MLALGPLAFAAPWLLLALAALPIIWWLLRVTPPAPRRMPFPAIRLLLGLAPREETPARTPWWLIALRTILAALVIIALAHPLLNPHSLLPGHGQLVLAIDDGWAAARDWNARQAAALDILAEAGREDRPVVLVTTAPPAADEPPPPLAPIRAADARAAVEALQPKPWPVDRAAATARLQPISPGNATAAIWISDGIADPGAAGLAGLLADGAGLRYLTAADTPRLIAPGSAPNEIAGKDLEVAVRSVPMPTPRPLTVRASAEDGALLARQTATLDPGADRVLVRLAMPSELRNRVARIDIEGENSAGGVLLADERWRRRPVGVAASANPSAQPLLSDTYYLDRALAPFTEIRRGATADLLKRELAVLIYADSGPNSPVEEEAVGKWVSAGGLLLRFAGPRLAEQSDHLLPVRLRRGGRTIGGALSWEKPAQLAPFADTESVRRPRDTQGRDRVAPGIGRARSSTCRARPGRGSPTAPRWSPREKRDKGWVVLVHTTANADWSNLALSGLFVEMLRRVVAMSQGVTASGEEALAAAGNPRRFRPAAARPADRAADRRRTSSRPPLASPRHPPGFYGAADTRRALNLSHGIGALKPIVDLPAGTVRAGFARSAERDFRAAAADCGADPGADRPPDRLRAARVAAGGARRRARRRCVLAGVAPAGARRMPTTISWSARPRNCASPISKPAPTRSTRSAAPGSSA